MLAQNFKTAADLRISDAEFDALRKVLGMFEREEIPEELFRMCQTGAPECGTPGCLRGWARTIYKPGFLISGLPGGLMDLFYPMSHAAAGIRANRSEAAFALRNYLTHGEPRWAEALSA